MNIGRLPTSNIDRLDGAVEHILSVCGALSDAALNDFAKRYAEQRGKKLPGDYAKRVLIPRMKRRGNLFQTTYNSYSLTPMLPTDAKGLNSFWAFLELMDNVDLESMQNGPFPSRISYIKNNRLYHIVPCAADGGPEMSAAANLEIEKQQRIRMGRKDNVDERFVFVFTSIENMKKSAVVLKSHHVFCVVSYPDKSTGIAMVRFYDPHKPETWY